jgi:hypothetical protein
MNLNFEQRAYDSTHFSLEGAPLPPARHCEEQSDAAIHTAVRFPGTPENSQGRLDCRGPAALAMTELEEMALEVVSLASESFGKGEKR